MSVAIIARSLEAEELLQLRANIPEAMVFVLQVNSQPLPDGCVSLSPPPQRVKTSYENYLSYSVSLFLKTRSFRKVLFWKCPELAACSLQMKTLGLGMEQTEIGVTRPMSLFTKDRKYLALQALSLSVSLVPSKFEAAAFYLRAQPLAVSHHEVPGNPPSLTIAVNHRNRWNYLREALDSLARQSTREFQLLVGDDASESGTEFESLSRWVRERFGGRARMIRSKSVLGPGALRNQLASEAQTDFIAFFDDDNLARGNLVESWLQAAGHADFDALSCGFSAFSEDERRTAQSTDVIFLGPCEELMFEMNHLGDSASLFKRRAFLEVRGFREQPGLLFEDWELFARMHQRGLNVRTVPIVLYDYRVHSDQRGVRDDSKKGLDAVRALARKARREGPKDLTPGLEDALSGWQGFENSIPESASDPARTDLRDGEAASPQEFPEIR